MEERSNQPIILQGQKIYLRELRPDDATEHYLNWLQDSQVTKFLECRFSSYSLQSLREYIITERAAKNNFFLAIILKELGKHIGNVKIGPINWIHGFSDIGIMIGDKDSWGQGHGTEAIALTTQYAFETVGLNKLNAGCYNVNMASAEVFKKAGFTGEGTRRKQYIYENKLVDDLLFGMTRSDYEEGQHEERG